MIPKTIWQTHRFPGDKLPPYIEAATGTWREINPDFEYRYVSNEEAIDQIDSFQNGRFSKIIRHRYITGYGKADIWRIVVLQSLGGIYVDCDIAARMPINEFIDLSKDFVAAGVPPEYFEPSELLVMMYGKQNHILAFNNDFMCSAPNNIFINTICDAAEEMCHYLMKHENHVIGPDCGPWLIAAALNKLWESIDPELKEKIMLSPTYPNFQRFPVGNFGQWPILGSFDQALIQLNGSFRWSDVLDKNYLSYISNIFDKFMDPEDQSSMVKCGYVDLPEYRTDPKDTEPRMQPYQQLDVKFSLSSTHIGPRIPLRESTQNGI
jgi:hypothetical protein